MGALIGRLRARRLQAEGEANIPARVSAIPRTHQIADAHSPSMQSNGAGHGLLDVFAAHAIGDDALGNTNAGSGVLGGSSGF